MATVLSAIAVLAVLTISEHGLERESVPHAVRGFSGNPDFIVASEAPEDTFVEVDRDPHGSLFGTDENDLPKSLRRQAEHVGEEAKAPTDQVPLSKKAEAARVAAKGEHKRRLYKNKSKKASSESAYKSNCMTLKSYAMNVADQMDDMSRAINILKPILLAVAQKGDCTAQLDAEFSKINNDKNIHLVDSIAADMSTTIEHEMKEGRGILVWKNLEYHNANCQLDPVECLKISKTKKTGANFVYIDAERVGWSGSPTVFNRLAVRSSAILDTARKLHSEATLVKNANPLGKTKSAPFLTKDQNQLLGKWKGNM